jgi:hypothetical protein
LGRVRLVGLVRLGAQLGAPCLWIFGETLVEHWIAAAGRKGRGEAR